ncbi:ABC transporter permease [Blastococcus saxobsidens]|uniref:Transport permease protein n=1 Tax=Blastococcus saxobsidens (strain DD2) TaxID=1146883 RepID=H6RLE7_BLASD|nr:ABC transporter permease [Blastococcus saxobsidens]CCG02473.1 ABC-type polysaccharide/polyol phosphate export systems, permease component [Blastococcus saxobsidens DD2]
MSTVETTAPRQALLWRVFPLYPLSARRAGHLVHRNFLVAKRTWPLFVSGMFEPFFYLLSIGVGIGGLIGTVVTDTGASLSYQEFVAPGLMAAAAMNGAIYDSVFNLFFKLRYSKLYDAVLATPLSAPDVAVGEVAWSLMRGATYSAAFLGIMVVMGLVGSWWAVLALPAAILIGFAFAAVGLAATTFLRGWQDFEFVQLVLLPLFLFSTTFYPLSTYPGPLQVVVQCTPLYHGIELIRGLVTGDVGWSLLGNAGYLVVMGLVGLTIGARRLSGLLLK